MSKEKKQRIANPSEVADERTTTSFDLDQEQQRGVLAALLHKFLVRPLFLLRVCRAGVIELPDKVEVSLPHERDR